MTKELEKVLRDIHEYVQKYKKTPDEILVNFKWIQKQVNKHLELSTSTIPTLYGHIIKFDDSVNTYKIPKNEENLKQINKLNIKLDEETIDEIIEIIKRDLNNISPVMSVTDTEKLYLRTENKELKSKLNKLQKLADAYIAIRDYEWEIFEQGDSKVLIPPESDKRRYWTGKWDEDGIPQYLPNFSECEKEE